MMDLDWLHEQNSWWKTGNVKKDLMYEYKRKLFTELKKNIQLRQILAVVGLRRTGKTTLFYQIINSLINNGVQPKRILYFSFDETTGDLKTLINTYQENILGHGLAKEQTYIFLDEIQKLKDWQNKIKAYYDLYPNIKFFVSGSASLNILIDAKENLAGRIFYFTMQPLDFEEFLELKGMDIQKIKENFGAWKQEIKIELNNYLLRPFPEIINAEDSLAKKYIKESIIERAIFRDLSSIFEIKDIELIDKIIHILAANPGMIVNLDDLSKDLGRSRQSISNYLFYLECCFLAKSLLNFRGSLKVSSRKLKKYYLIHPGTALALASPEKGKVIENLVQFATGAEHYWREGNKEVDFIITKEKILPIESKYTSSTGLKEVKGLIKFMTKYKIKKGYVITEDCERIEKIEGKTIEFIPAWKWLLEPQ